MDKGAHYLVDVTFQIIQFHFDAEFENAPTAVTVICVFSITTLPFLRLQMCLSYTTTSLTGTQTFFLLSKMKILGKFK